MITSKLYNFTTYILQFVAHDDCFSAGERLLLGEGLEQRLLLDSQQFGDVLHGLGVHDVDGLVVTVVLFLRHKREQKR